MPTRKKIVEWVHQERQTQEGFNDTEAAAKRDVFIRSRASGYGKYSPDINTIFVDPEASASTGFPQGMLHHELTHEDLEAKGKGSPPSDLSSYDKELYRLGNEGRAFVAQEEDRRVRAHEPPMNDQEKQEWFIKNSAQSMRGYTNGLSNKSRSDGRQMTMDEFAGTFGTIPGHEDHNFLKGTGFKDPANFFDNRPGSDFHTSHVLAESKPIKLEDMPKASEKLERFDSEDKNYIVLVRHEQGGKEQVEMYRYHPEGEKIRREWDAKGHETDTILDLGGYRKIDQKVIEPTDHGYDREVHHSELYGRKLDGSPKVMGIEVDVGNVGSPTSTLVKGSTDYDITSNTETPLKFHKIEPEAIPAQKEQPGQAQLHDPHPTDAHCAAFAAMAPVTKMIGNGNTPDSGYAETTDLASLREKMSSLISGGQEAAVSHNNAYLNAKPGKSGLSQSA